MISKKFIPVALFASLALTACNDSADVEDDLQQDVQTVSPQEGIDDRGDVQDDLDDDIYEQDDLNDDRDDVDDDIDDQDDDFDDDRDDLDDINDDRYEN